MSPMTIDLTEEAGVSASIFRHSENNMLHPEAPIKTNGFMAANGSRVSQQPSRGPISPPPMKRTSSSFMDRTDTPPSSSMHHTAKRSQASAASSPRYRATQAGPSRTQQRRTAHTSSPEQARAPIGEWTTSQLVSEVEGLQQQAREAHATLVEFSLESATVKDRRVHQGEDLFAGLLSTSVDHDKETTMRIKFKQHFTKTKKDNREEHHKVIGIKTSVSRVPGYRYHHVGVRKNILAPNTPLLFTPHLRDLDSHQEAKYHDWLRDLENQDIITGFTPIQREDKYKRTIQKECTRHLAMFIDQWIEKLAIPMCGKADLIRFMAAETNNAEQSSSVLPDTFDSDQEDTNMNWEALRGFVQAFDLVFETRQPENKKVKLKDVIHPDGPTDLAIPGSAARGGTDPAQDEVGMAVDDSKHVVDTCLETYSLLGCLICFGHDCEHGEYAPNNDKTSFAYGSGQRSITFVLEKKARLERSLQDHSGRPHLNDSQPCQNRCHLLPRQSSKQQAFSPEERSALRAVVTTSNTTKITLNPICLAAAFLDRDCDAVFLELQEMNIQPGTHRGPLPDPQQIESVSWYDRHRKVLLGDWQDHLGLAEEREIIEPCCHEGPCVRGRCTCVDQGVLCDKFCECSVENCAYKFTGCACHSVGKSCQQSQQEKPHCICVQLQRECDPDLCGTCGALERADPLNSRDDALHSTGCQNVALQRGVSRTVLLGQSQLSGVMYGLFAGEDIAEGQFIIEYVGELISHDEGERRGQRRSDVFSDTQTPSYLFELLKKDCLYVDAAVYGNLSRYINHAGDKEKDKRNIMPRVLYVKGDYRIKFMASRDIKAGEELFFDYGQHFPEVSNFVNSREDDPKAGTKRRRGRPILDQRNGNGRAKGTRALPKSRKRRRFEPDPADGQSTLESDWETGHASTRPVKRRRRRRDVDSASAHPDPADNQPRFASPVHRGEAVDSDVGRTRARGAPGRAAVEEQNTTPTASGPPKLKGRRGGARPGSGRPRKHPRPGEETGPSPKKGRQTKKKTMRTEEKEQTEMEIDEELQARASSSPKVPSPPAADIYNPPSSPVVRDSEDEDDDSAYIESRERMSRPRRPPAKYRDEEDIWS